MHVRVQAVRVRRPALVAVEHHEVGFRTGNKRLYGSHSHSDDNDEPPPAASGGQRRGWYSSQDWQIWTLEHHSSGSGAYGIVVSPCFDSNC